MSSPRTARSATTTACGRSCAPTASARSPRRARRAGRRERFGLPDHDRPAVGPLRRQRRVARHPPAHDAVGPRHPGARRRAERVPPAARRRHPGHGAAPARRRRRSGGDGQLGRERAGEHRGVVRLPGRARGHRGPLRADRRTPSTACRSTPRACTSWPGGRPCPGARACTAWPRRCIPTRWRERRPARGVASRCDPEEPPAAELLAAMRVELNDALRDVQPAGQPCAGPVGAARRPMAPTSSATRAQTRWPAGACAGWTTAWRKSSGCRAPGGPVARRGRGAPRRARGRGAVAGLRRRCASTPGPSRSTRCASTVAPATCDVPPYNDNPFACFWGEKTWVTGVASTAAAGRLCRASGPSSGGAGLKRAQTMGSCRAAGPRRGALSDGPEFRPDPASRAICTLAGNTAPRVATLAAAAQPSGGPARRHRRARPARSGRSGSCGAARGWPRHDRREGLRADEVDDAAAAEHSGERHWGATAEASRRDCTVAA